MSEFGDELRRLLGVRGMSVRECARAVPCDSGYVSKLAGGVKQPSPEMAARFDAVLGAGGALVALAVASANRRDVLRLGLAAAVTPETLQGVLAGAAAEALEFTRLAGVTAVGRGVLDHLQAVIAGLDRAYCVQRPADVFPVARAYRARVAELIEGPCTLRERRELYACAGWLSELLAWLAHDLGSSLTAEAFAIDSFEHADQAGHGELCGWAADALASVALYSGRPGRAASAALEGAGLVPEAHPLAVRLRAQAARAYARLGNGGECERLLNAAEHLHDRLPALPPPRAGLDTGMLATFAVTAYAASAWIWLGDFGQAAAYGRRAVAAHESAPAASRSPSREAIARIDLGIACAGLGDPGEAAALGCQALSSARIVESVRLRAADLDEALSARYPGQEDALAFRSAYCEVTAAQGDHRVR